MLRTALASFHRDPSKFCTRTVHLLSLPPENVVLVRSSIVRKRTPLLQVWIYYKFCITFKTRLGTGIEVMFIEDMRKSRQSGLYGAFEWRRHNQADTCGVRERSLELSSLFQAERG